MLSDRTDAIAEVIAAAAAGHTDRAADLTARLIVGQTPDSLYETCCKIAAYGPLALNKLNADMQASNAHGTPWVLDHVRPKRDPGDPAQDFAVQFLDAHCDGQQQTTRSLYDAMRQQGDRHMVQSVSHLINDVARATLVALTSRKRPGSAG